MMLCADDGSLWGKGGTESCEVEELYLYAENYCDRLDHCWCGVLYVYCCM